MTGFTVIAYEKEGGESSVEDFINGLDVKMRAKMYGLLSILQEKGNTLREPYSKYRQGFLMQKMDEKTSQKWN